MSAEGMRRPIQIEEFKLAIKGMSDDELIRIKSEINNNISHLRRSNDRLLAYVDKIEGKPNNPDFDDMEELDKIDSNDLQLFKESLLENQIVMKNCNERIDALEQEKIYRESGPMSTEAKVSAPNKTPNSIYL